MLTTSKPVDEEMLALTLLCLAICTGHAISQGVPCVCTLHAQSRIFDGPDSNSKLVGFVYQNDCKAHQPSLDQPGFYAVQHFHQIGYIEADFGIENKTCTQLTLDPDDRLTTGGPTNSTKAQSETTTTTAKAPHVAGSHTTTPVTGSLTTPRLSATTGSHPVSQAYTSTSVAHAGQNGHASNCNKLAVFMDVAKEINVGLLTSARCPDNFHHAADVMVTAFCGAPVSSQWLRGQHVLSNCGLLAKYVPIATFDQTASYKQFAGIFLGCGHNSIHVVTQNCSTGLHIREITDTAGTTPHPDEFYVVEW